MFWPAAWRTGTANPRRNATMRAAAGAIASRGCDGFTGRARNVIPLLYRESGDSPSVFGPEPTGELSVSLNRREWCAPPEGLAAANRSRQPDTRPPPPAHRLAARSGGGQRVIRRTVVSARWPRGVFSDQRTSDRDRRQQRLRSCVLRSWTAASRRLAAASPPGGVGVQPGRRPRAAPRSTRAIGVRG